MCSHPYFAAHATKVVCIAELLLAQRVVVLVDLRIDRLHRHLSAGGEGSGHLVLNRAAVVVRVDVGRVDLGGEGVAVKLVLMVDLRGECLEVTIGLLEVATILVEAAQVVFAHGVEATRLEVEGADELDGRVHAAGPERDDLLELTRGGRVELGDRLRLVVAQTADASERVAGLHAQGVPSLDDRLGLGDHDDRLGGGGDDGRGGSGALHGGVDGRVAPIVLRLDDEDETGEGREQHAVDRGEGDDRVLVLLEPPVALDAGGETGHVLQGLVEVLLVHRCVSWASDR